MMIIKLTPYPTDKKINMRNFITIVESNLFERVYIGDFIEQASEHISSSVIEFARKMLKDWERAATTDRRERLGYDRYDHQKGSKPFDAYEFEEANQRDDWNASMAVADNLDNLIPPIENGGSNVTYALMGKVSDSLTSLLRKYVETKFGSTIILGSGDNSTEVPISELYVSIWWSGNEYIYKGNYGGLYSARSFHANGTHTKLEIIVDRKEWAEAFRSLIGSLIASDHLDLNLFLDSVIPTLSHEYAHLEQDIKGQKSYEFSLLPGRDETKRVSRNSRGAYEPDDSEKMLRYRARPAEIDAVATEVANSMVEREIRRLRQSHDKWSNKPWSSEDVDTETWNEHIHYMMSDVKHGYVNDLSYHRYVTDIKNAIQNGTTLHKSDLLMRVQKRFLSTLYKRLAVYLRSKNHDD